MIKGGFAADFGSFYDACAKAETSLKAFESDAGKVEKSLDRMVNSLSGTKLVQDATLMVEAIDRVGGVSHLTEKELARVSATALEAANKMRAMGQDVPPGLARIAAEAKTVDKAHGDILGTVKSLATGFLAMFTVRAAIDFAKSVIADASALKDLGQQTHISVEELQILAGGMSEFGVDADTLGKGLYTLSRKIAGGDAGIAEALATMGIQMKEVEGLNGEALFLKIMNGLSQLQGGLRDDTSAAIFGGKLGMAMAGASEGIEGAMATWRAHNKLMSTDTVNALDAYDESIKRATKSLSAMAAGVMGRSAEMFNVVNDAVERGAGKWATFWAVTKDVTAQLTMTGDGTSNLATLIDHLNVSMAAGTAATHANTTAQTANAGALAERVAKAKAQLAADKEAAEARKKADADAEAAAKSLLALQDRLFGRDLIAKAAEYDKALGGINNVSRLVPAAQAEMNTALAGAIEALKAAGLGASDTAAHYHDLLVQTTDWAKVNAKVAAMPDPFKVQNDARRQSFRDTQMAILDETQGITDSQLAWQNSGGVFEIVSSKIVEDVNKIGSAATGAAGQAKQEFVTAFQAIGNAADDAAARVARVLQLASDNAANAKGNPSMGANFGTASIINQMAARSVGLTIPQFAGGGSGDFGTGTLAMLHGKETITPWGQGGATIHAPISIVVGPGGDARRAGREAADALLARLKERGVRL